MTHGKLWRHSAQHTKSSTTALFLDKPTSQTSQQRPPLSETAREHPRAWQQASGSNRARHLHPQSSPVPRGLREQTPPGEGPPPERPLLRPHPRSTGSRALSTPPGVRRFLFPSLSCACAKLVQRFQLCSSAGGLPGGHQLGLGHTNQRACPPSPAAPLHCPLAQTWRARVLIQDRHTEGASFAAETAGQASGKGIGGLDMP